jgi:ABC-type transport system substrate-binding protein
MVFGFNQEPASLWTAVEYAVVTHQAYNLIGGYSISSPNYEYGANEYVKRLPTLENGGATLAPVTVKEGDTVVDADGNVGPLAAGMSIKDGEGNVVEYTGGDATMQRLVLKWELVDGITWSDGEPLRAADMALAENINCDLDSGAATYYDCERTANTDYTDTSATITLVPGYTPSLYFTIGNAGCTGPCWYPAHRVLSDGRRLSNVPASQWATLPEIAESPIGTGPYIITNWTKGQSMTFRANPYFYLGAPRTPNIIIRFVSDTNQAVAELFTGDVDVIFSETLGAGAEVQTVRDAAAAGRVSLYILPSATWEHIDMNLNVP